MRKQNGTSKTSVKKMISRYRTLVETSPDPCVARIAQGMETALIWATQETRGWSRSMKDEPILLGEFLRIDLANDNKKT